MPIKKLRPPQEATCHDEARQRLAAAVRPPSRLTQPDPRAMFHQNVVQVDPKPMPGDHSTMGWGPDALHSPSRIMMYGPDLQRYMELRDEQAASSEVLPSFLPSECPR